jgi:hypothetical protein
MTSFVGKQSLYWTFGGLFSRDVGLNILRINNTLEVTRTGARTFQTFFWKEKTLQRKNNVILFVQDE